MFKCLKKPPISYIIFISNGGKFPPFKSCTCPIFHHKLHPTWPLKVFIFTIIGGIIYILRLEISTQIDAFDGINLYINSWKIRWKLSEFTPISVEIKGKFFPPPGSHSGIEKNTIVLTCKHIFWVIWRPEELNNVV